MADCNLYISGLTQKVTNQEFFEFVGHKAGSVKSVTDFKDGISFLVTFESTDVAAAAFEKLDGQSFRGDSLIVSKTMSEESEHKLDKTSMDQKLLDIFSMLDQEKKLNMLQLLSHSTNAATVGDSNSNKTSYVRLDTTRLPFFSGDKGETKYNQWRLEIECLMRDETTSEAQIWQAVRRSVKGSAAEVVTNMGPNSTITQLLDKFDARFGNAQSLEQMLQDFYTSGQQSSESVVDWGCRLEDSMATISKRGKFSSPVTRDMLRGKFWSGLRSEYIRTALRHRFDAGEHLEQLIKIARVVEREQFEREKVATTKEVKPKSCQQNVVEDLVTKKLDEILKQMRALDGRVQKIERQHKVANSSSGSLTSGGNSLSNPDSADCMKYPNTHSSGMPHEGIYTAGSSGSYDQRWSHGRPRSRGSMRSGWGSRESGFSKRYCYICGDPSHLSYNCPLN